MATMVQKYAQAVRDFETLTDKKVPTFKTKGKEAGIKKLKGLFKSGKSLEQRIADFQKASDACSGARPDTAKSALKNLESALAKLDDALKKHIASFRNEERALGPEDRDLKTGFAVFIGRLDELRRWAKLDVETRKTGLKELAGKTVGADEKTKSDIKQVYQNLMKGCAETEALMKMFLSRPTPQNMEAAFTSATGPRSISVSMTLLKQRVLARSPVLKKRLRADPDTLLQKIWDLTQRKGPGYWQNKLQMNKPGWESRAKVVAQDCLAQVNNWRVMADDLRKLAA